MSYNAIIARVKTKPHPNADRIQLADVLGTTVVVGLQTQDNELGVYFPSDGVLSHEFCLANNLYSKSAVQKLGLPEPSSYGFFDHHRRVRTQRFRGEKSDGLWMPLNSLSTFCSVIPYNGVDVEGTMFDNIGGQQVCSKWTTRKPNGGTPGKPRKAPKGELVGFPKHQDTEQWDYYKGDIPDGSLLTLTEKLHGTSHRVGLVMDDERKWWQFWKPKYRIVHGTRNVVQTDSSVGYYSDESFRQRAVGQLEGIRKGEVLFGEIVGYAGADSPIMPSATVDKKELPDVFQQYGPQVSYLYGCKPGEAKFYVYRIVQFNEDGQGVDLSHAQVVRRCRDLGLNVVPFLRAEVYNEDFAIADDQINTFVGEVFNPSQVCPQQMAEGVIIRVDTPDGHTRFLKKKSFAFKLLEGIIKSQETYVDLEESA